DQAAIDRILGPEPIHRITRPGFWGTLGRVVQGIGLALNPELAERQLQYQRAKAELIMRAQQAADEAARRREEQELRRQQLEIQRQQAEEQARHNKAMEQIKEPQKWERVETDQGVMYVNPYTLEERPAGFQPKPEKPKTLAEALLSNDPAVQARARQALEAEESIRARYRTPEGANTRDVAAIIQTVNRAESEMANLDRLVSAANELLNHPGLEGATGKSGLLLANIPGTSAADFRAKLQTLRSQIAFNTLQAIRNASKTGGALGSISERELELLQNNIDSLDLSQSGHQFRQSLNNIISTAQNLKLRAQEAAQREIEALSGGSRQPQKNRTLFTTGQSQSRVAPEGTVIEVQGRRMIKRGGNGFHFSSAIH